MATALHVNQRDPERDLEIATARAGASRIDVAQRFGITVDAVTAICAKVRKQKTYELKISRPGERETPVGTIVTHKGFAEACIGAYRHYGEFFRGLDLPDWYLTDGTTQLSIVDIRKEIAERSWPSAAASNGAATHQ